MRTSFFAKAAGSALIAASLFAGASANAATTLVFNGESASFSSTIAANSPASFSHEYLFDVPAMSISDPFGTISVSATRDGDTVENTTLSFFSVNADNSHSALVTKYHNGKFFLKSDLLPTGHYGFDFAGTLLNPAKGGSYGGTLTLNVSPVPEPETYALLLAGLGLLAFTARRKENNKVG